MKSPVSAIVTLLLLVLAAAIASSAASVKYPNDKTCRHHCRCPCGSKQGPVPSAGPGRRGRYGHQAGTNWHGDITARTAGELQHESLNRSRNILEVQAPGDGRTRRRSAGVNI